MAEYVLAHLQKGADATGPDDSALRLFVHGGPGSGKTFLVNCIVECAARLGVKSVCGAFAASAANNLPEGGTLHGLLGLSVHGNGNEKLAGATRAQVIERFARVRVLIIDEISMVPPTLLGTSLWCQTLQSN